MILLLRGSWCSDGCLEHERIALLQLKIEFISSSSSSYEMPSTVIVYNSYDYDMPLWGVNTDCCNWGGVKCNTTTGHVVELSLGGGEELLKLSNLQYLNLGYNNFSINNLSFLNGLSSLKVLHIADIQLKGSFDLKDLGLSQLEELDLSRNNITKFVDSRGLPHLKDLEYLALDGSIINNNILQSIGVMSSLKKLSLHGCELNDTNFLNQGLPHLKDLEYLALDRSIINNNILQSIGVMSSLKKLSLSGCELNDTKFLNQGVCKLKQLQELDISYNEISGSLPSCLANLTSLQFLHLSSNNFVGNISLSPLRDLTNLELLEVSDNLFQIPISLSPFFNHSKLKFFVSRIGTYLPRLRHMDLSSNGFNGSIPSSFGNMSLLRSLDLSNNRLSGTIPKHLTMDCVSLTEVYLSKNQLQGSLKHAFCDCPELVVLDLSHNNMTGSIPSGIGRFSQLSYMILGHNNIEGEIPIQLCNLTQLSLIDLSHNNLSGHILPCLRSTSNSYLLAKICQIPIQIGNLNEIHVLNLSHNNLIGKIPASFSNLSQVESLDLSYNNLQGHIPSQLTELNFLEVFNVSYNNLSGRTPERVAQFATFDESSYRGNPLLYGWPMQKNWIVMVSPPSTSRSSINDEESNFFMDMGVFYD
ncbi:hypothetical protein GH714_012131 [Hevea brasiliensis]|uniref:Leucine-rich repeat-containing N-terminal plant-type domain-containing protein n=1 Tax=Hevea brasiliensis TaxID=3981 RepID=A0A6A6MTD9_HEVBR|nr:hypothetical protein GH714_012131 [Hevea brasiliensis]